MSYELEDRIDDLQVALRRANWVVGWLSRKIMGPKNPSAEVMEAYEAYNREQMKEVS